MSQSITKKTLLGKLQHPDFLVNWRMPKTQGDTNYVCCIMHDPLATYEGQLKICPLDQSINMLCRITVKDGRKLLAEKKFKTITVVKKSALQKVGKILSGQEVLILIKQTNHVCFLKFNSREYTFTTTSIRNAGGAMTLSIVDAISLCLHGKINNAELLTGKKFRVNIPKELKVLVS